MYVLVFNVSITRFSTWLKINKEQFAMIMMVTYVSELDVEQINDCTVSGVFLCERQYKFA